MITLMLIAVAAIGGFWILVGLVILALAARVMVGEALRAIGLSIKRWFVASV